MQHPIKNEECLRDFFLKKKLIMLSNRGKKKIFENLMIIIIKHTRFNDFSDMFRTFNGKKIWFSNFSKFFKNSFFNKNIVVHYPIIVSFNYFLENFLDKFLKIENYFAIQKFFHSFLINKKKFRSSDFLIKKLSVINFMFKKNLICIAIMNHENLLAKKNFDRIQCYLEWFSLSLEKSFSYKYYIERLNFSLGKIAIIEKKKAKAFSFFVEAIENIDKKNFRNKIILIEWLIFSSIFLKKISTKNRLLNDSISFRSKNLLKIKVLYNSFEKNNAIFVERIIYKPNGRSITINSFFLLVKKFFKRIKNKIKQFLSIFIRMSITQISIRLGTSRKKTEMFLSYNTLKGNQKGYFDCSTDCYLVFLKIKPEIKSNIFMLTSINLDNLINLSSQKKFNILKP
jgi:hypothetical protein